MIMFSSLEGTHHRVLLPVWVIRLSTNYANRLGIGKVEFRGRRVGKHLGHPSPSSPDQDSNLHLSVLGSLDLHETSALANYATEAGIILKFPEAFWPHRSGYDVPLHPSLIGPRLVTPVMAALILFLASLVVATQAFQCPMSCRCLTSNQAACNNTTLSELPQEFDANLTHLIFNYNNLTLLRNSTFEKTPWISVLYLEGNGIRHIEPDTFRHLQNLSTVSLLDNNISNIHPDTFTYNSRLKVLILKGNYFHLADRTTFLNSNSLLELVLSSCYIDYLPNEAFRGLPNLLSLKLDFNKLHWLNFYSFSPLTRLTELKLNDNKLESLRNYPKTPALMSLRNVDLSNNYLNTLEVDILEQMVNVVKLDLTSNHLVCVCNLTAAYDWLTSRRVMTQATCFAPSLVRGRDWMVLRTMNCGGQVGGSNGTTIWGNSSSSNPNQQGSNWGPNVATQGRNAQTRFGISILLTLVPFIAVFCNFG
uniref:Uncharacterized protein n=1 Tax=Timema bartmani TaxID=61472 RepID=A0A7R9ETG7_9NEOP|nr:unnamed protein product [Timema bartmani]